MYYTKFRPSRNSGIGVRRIIMVNKANSDVNTKYVVGSGVGYTPISIRHQLQRRANNFANGTGAPCNCF